MGNQLPPWDARVRLHQAQEAAAAAPKPPRAIDPNSALPFNRPTHLTNLTFKTMDRILLFLTGWIVRYLTTAFTTFGLLWGASGEQSANAAAYAGAAIVWVLLAVFRQVKLWVLRRVGKPVAVDPAKLGLVLLCGLSLTFFPCCRATGRGLVKVGAAVVDTGCKPTAWRQDLKSPVARVVLIPVTLPPAIAGGVIGVPMVLIGAAMGGIN